jgi:hypothetical protein
MCWLPPSLDRDESCESVFTRDSSMHQKCSNFALTNLLFGLCKFMWIIELLVIHLSLILGLQHAPLPPKCYEPGTLVEIGQNVTTLFATTCDY